MARILAAVLVILGGLLALGRLTATQREAPVQMAARVAPTPRIDVRPPALPTGNLAAPLPGPAPGRTPIIERLARLEARRQLIRLGSHTYLDSLLLTSDSTVRRWRDRFGMPLRVAFEPTLSYRGAQRLVGIVQHALTVWESTAVGVRFQLVADTTGAEIVVRWIDRFDTERAGQADVQSAQDGTIRWTLVTIALRTAGGEPILDEALRAVAVHEFGHALGLPHSADPGDAMYGVTRIARLSTRDRASVALLYTLPPGSVRDPGGS